MKASSPRELIAQAAIVLAVCVGAWMMLVKPNIDELARLEQQASATSPSETVNQQSVEDAARKISTLKDRVRHIQTFNELANDSSRLYGIVMDLADTHGVQVHSLQPGSAKQTENDGKITLTRITLGVDGEYERLAAFLDAVCTVNAFIRPVTLQIDPARANQTGVQATLTCDVLSFAMASSVQELLASTASGSVSAAPPASQFAGATQHAKP